MRPTGLGHGAYKDDPDFVVYSGAWQIGRIYERRGFPDHVRWVWSLYGVVLTRPPGIPTDGNAPTLEAAKAKFDASWKRWLEWAGLVEVGVNPLKTWAAPIVRRALRHSASLRLCCNSIPARTV